MDVSNNGEGFEEDYWQATSAIEADNPEPEVWEVDNQEPSKENGCQK